MEGGLFFSSQYPTVGLRSEPRPRGRLPSAAKLVLSQPEGLPEGRKAWRAREPDFSACRQRGCALERPNVRIMNSLCDIGSVPPGRGIDSPVRVRFAQGIICAQGLRLTHEAWRHSNADPRGSADGLGDGAGVALPHELVGEGFALSSAPA